MTSKRKTNINKSAVTRRYTKWHTEVLVYLDNAVMPEAHNVFNQDELADLMRDGFVTDYHPALGWNAILSVETDKMVEAGFYVSAYVQEMTDWKAKQQEFFDQRDAAYQEWLATPYGQEQNAINEARMANRN